MTNNFIKVYVVALVICFNSCCFVKLKNKSNLDKIGYVIPCETALINYLDKHWYPNRENDCHLFDSINMAIAFKYKTCFIGIRQKDLVSILGKSIGADSNLVTYRISTNCENYTMSQFFLTFKIEPSSKKVSDVVMSGSKISE